MKVKKPLIATVMGLSILCFGTGASATETDAVVDSGVTESYKQTEPGTISLFKAKPTNTSKTKTYSPVLGSAYAVASSSSSTKEDYIYAKCRTFNGSDGALIKSNSTSEKKSSYVSVKTVNGTAFFGNDWAIGNHTYKLSGYKDVNHETKAYW